LVPPFESIAIWRVKGKNGGNRLIRFMFNNLHVLFDEVF